jgi:hypothetical protein
MLPDSITITLTTGLYKVNAGKLVAGFWILVAGFWILVAGHWWLVAGLLPLVSGCH